MGAGIFLLGADGEIVEMRGEPYESEDVLQRLLADFPQLLAGEEFPGDEPRRFVLVTREAGVPGEEGGSGRWSLDHLFLDQTGVPTLVEVKRSSDTRARREVVAQMLDYAANAVVYWPAEQIREWFSVTCDEQDIDPDEALEALVGAPDLDVEGYWETVHTNLRAGRLRLVFIADEIATELQRIVEFLNEQMSETEVLAVEIHHYRNGDQRILVPRVIGQTAVARQAKRVASSRGEKWDEESFFADAEARLDPEDVLVVRDLHHWSVGWSSQMNWGSGKTSASVYPRLDHYGGACKPFGMRSNGTVDLLFVRLASRPPFDRDEKRNEFRERLNEIPGVDLAPDAIGRAPTIRVALLRSPAAMTTFKNAVEWVLAEVKAT